MSPQVTCASASESTLVLGGLVWPWDMHWPMNRPAEDSESLNELWAQPRPTGASDLLGSRNPDCHSLKLKPTEGQILMSPLVFRAH